MMEARIEQVCISEPVTVLHEGTEVLTGIFKQPVDGRVGVEEMGIVGDGQANVIHPPAESVYQLCPVLRHLYPCQP